MSLRELVRPTWGTAAYVLVVAATAALGFGTDSTPPILLAILLALPATIVTIPAYYAAYGLLALVPGANPSSSSGYSSCTPDGSCHQYVSGDPAAWFTLTTGVLGVMAIAGAALVNVLGVRMVIALRRRGA